MKRVFIMLEQQVLLAQLSEKEIDFAIERYQAEVLNAPASCNSLA